MAEPMLSIIVPVYKVEPYLQKCIDSILNQTFRDLELILVDDGSPDNCPAICDAAAEKDERVVVLHRKNAGLSAARNAGLSAARGNYIGFVDSDDYIAPDMYQTLYDAMLKNDAQLAICNYTYVDVERNVLRKWRSPIKKAETLNRVQAMDRLGGDGSWYYITAWNRLYSRELFENIRFPLGKLHEDEYVVHRIYWACERIVIVPRPLYYYVQRGGSIMRQKSLKRYLDNIWGIFDRMDFAQEHGLNRLAFRSCNVLLGLLVQVRLGEVRIEKEEKILYKRERARIRGRLDGQLRMPGYGEYKARILLYLVSPRLCAFLMKLKREQRERRLKKEEG